jgi:hypothetical protein
MVYVIVLALLLAVVFIVSRPLLRAQGGRTPVADAGALASDRIDLEAARDAKLREIRDAELDHQTGKLSDADYALVDSTLRAQAIEILNRLDELRTPGSSERLP